MMKLDLQFSCPMTWEQLSDHDERSKMCKICSKKVIDLEKLNDDQIHQEFKGKESVCAKVPMNRLNEWITPFQKALAAIVICFAGTLFTVEFAHGQTISAKCAIQVNTKRIKGRIIDDFYFRPVENARIMYKMEQKEYEVFTDSFGNFTIDLPKKYVALNLNVFYEGQLKTTRFEERLSDEERNTGDIEIPMIGADEKNGARWISGTVFEDWSDEVISFANLHIEELDVDFYTNSEGQFKFPVIEGIDSLTLVVSFIGYHQKIVKLDVEEASKENFEIYLDGEVMTLGALEVKIEYQGPVHIDLIQDHVDPMHKKQNQVIEGVHRNGQTWILNRRDF